MAAVTAFFYLMAYNMVRDGERSLIIVVLKAVVDRAILFERRIELSNVIARQPSGNHSEIIRRTYSALQNISENDLGCELDIDLRDVPAASVHQSVVIVLDHSPVVAALFFNGTAPEIAPYFDIENLDSLLDAIPGLSGQTASDWRQDMLDFLELMDRVPPLISAQECQNYSFFLIEEIN